jgi:hypothetical protein
VGSDRSRWLRSAPSTTVFPDWTGQVRSLLEAPSPAVLTIYRKDGSAHTVPVWFRWTDPAFEVVIAEGNVKLRHLARDPWCVLVVNDDPGPGAAAADPRQPARLGSVGDPAVVTWASHRAAARSAPASRTCPPTPAADG